VEEVNRQSSSDADAKASVMDAIALLVDRGVAELTLLDSGDMKLKLHSGEVFHLGDIVVTRVG
jgi:hypothetical protein